MVAVRGGRAARGLACMMMNLLVTFALAAHAVTPDGFPNSLAMDRPPRGWRSWSAYAGDVNQHLIEQVMDAMAKKRAGGRSLADLGYTGAETRWQRALLPVLWSCLPPTSTPPLPEGALRVCGQDGREAAREPCIIVIIMAVYP